MKAAQTTQDVQTTTVIKDKRTQKNSTKQPVQTDVSDNGLYILDLMLSDPEIKGVLCFNWRLPDMGTQLTTVKKLSQLGLIVPIGQGRDGYYYRITDAGRAYHEQQTT